MMPPERKPATDDIRWIAVLFVAALLVLSIVPATAQRYAAPDPGPEEPRIASMQRALRDVHTQMKSLQDQLAAVQADVETCRALTPAMTSSNGVPRTPKR